MEGQGLRKDGALELLSPRGESIPYTFCCGMNDTIVSTELQILWAHICSLPRLQIPTCLTPNHFKSLQ